MGLELWKVKARVIKGVGGQIEVSSGRLLGPVLCGPSQVLREECPAQSVVYKALCCHPAWVEGPGARRLLCTATSGPGGIRQWEFSSGEGGAAPS